MTNMDIENMAYTKVNEHISVGATFSSGKVTPRFFVWKRRRYRVEEVTYFWRTKAGSDAILHYAVTSDGSVYEISCNLKTLNWYLENAYVG